MLINLISSEPISFLIAFVSVCAFSLYSFIRGQANATKIAQLSQINEQLQNDLNSERIAIAKLQARTQRRGTHAPSAVRQGIGKGRGRSASAKDRNIDIHL